ncbi:YuxH family protein [Aquifex sp.]
MPRNVILKIIHPEGVSAQLLRDVECLKSKGFKIIVEGFRFHSPDYISLLRRADYLSCSIKLLRECSTVKEFATSLNKKIILTDIETERDYKLGLGFGDLFQGPYLAEPQLFRHYKNYHFLSSFLTRLIKQMREKSKGELYNIVKSDKHLRKVVELWVREFYPGQKLDTLELRIIIFLYLVKDIFLHTEGDAFMRTFLFRAFLMRELAEMLVPERSREAFITGLLSCCDEFLEISGVNIAKSLEYPEDILEALEGLKGHLGYLLSNVYLVEASMEQGKECEERTYAKIAYLFNRSPKEVKEIVERAKRKAEKLLTLLRRSEVRESIDLQQRNKLAQL